MVINFWTVRKLDLVPLKEWEMHLVSENDYTTFKRLNDFLNLRIRTLEAIQMSLFICKEFKALTIEKRKGFVVQ